MADKLVLPPTARHGTNYAYSRYGCRCAPCCSARSRYRSELNARDPEKYRDYMREYMRKYRAGKRDEGG
jgi:hypothetical protein